MDNQMECMSFLVCAAAWLLLKRRRKRRFRRWKDGRSITLPQSSLPVERKRALVTSVQERRARREREILWSEMILQDQNTFFEFTRMDTETFDSLLSIMGPHLQKKSRRTPLPPRVRLAMTLRYLATGESMVSIAGAFNCGRATVCIIVNDTCQRLWTALAPGYVNIPANREGWQKIANDFENKWNLPHCVGAVDCRHVSVVAQKSSSFPSSSKLGAGLVVLAVCDSNHCFTYVDIEPYDEQTGGGCIMKTSNFGKILNGGALALPAECPILGTNNVVLPYYFVGDEAFPLKSNLMRPYAGRELSDVKKIFNYRLSKVQKCMENVFGVLAARWHVYLHRINAHCLTVRNIIRATVCLHNFLKKRGDPLYCPSSRYLDEETNVGDVVPGQWRAEVDLHGCALQRVGRLGSNMSKRSSMQTRDTLAAYLVGEMGSVESQWHSFRKAEQE